jgi:hypothetical protein
VARRIFASGGVTLVVAVAVLLVAALQASAVRSGQTCPSFSASGSKYLVITYKSTSCRTAQAWLPKLVADKDPKAYGSFVLSNGPKGFHCMAVRAVSGRAAQGECYSGTSAFPKAGFQWST